jgi:hypothetical protein
MILLAQEFQTSSSSSFNGVTTNTTTNALSVTRVSIDFTAGAIVAKIQRGYLDPSTGIFTANMAPLSVVVKPDGSFTSSDGSWVGGPGALNVSALLADLSSAFDGAILGSGAVQGTEA